MTTVLFLKQKSFVGMTTISLPFCHQGSHLPCAYVPTHIHILYSQLKQNRIMDLSRGYQFNLAWVLHNPFMAHRVHIFFTLFFKIGLNSVNIVSQNDKCGVLIQRWNHVNIRFELGVEMGFRRWKRDWKPFSPTRDRLIK